MEYTNGLKVISSKMDPVDFIINSFLKNTFLQVAQKGSDTRRLEIPRKEAYIEIRRSDEG